MQSVHARIVRVSARDALTLLIDSPWSAHQRACQWSCQFLKKLQNTYEVFCLLGFEFGLPYRANGAIKRGGDIRTNVPSVWYVPGVSLR